MSQRPWGLRGDEMEEKRTPGEDEMYCWRCGSLIPREAEICVKCGVRVTGRRVRETGEKRRGWLIAGGVLGIVAGVFALGPGIAMVVDGATGYWWTRPDWVEIGSEFHS